MPSSCVFHVVGPGTCLEKRAFQGLPGPEATHDCGISACVLVVGLCALLRHCELQTTDCRPWSHVTGPRMRDPSKTHRSQARLIRLMKLVVKRHKIAASSSPLSISEDKPFRAYLCSLGTINSSGKGQGSHSPKDGSSGVGCRLDAAACSKVGRWDGRECRGVANKMEPQEEEAERERFEMNVASSDAVAT